MTRLIVTAAVVACLSTHGFAAVGQQERAISAEGQVSGTATITAIDPKTRSVTLRTEKGVEETFTAASEVKRFDQLKVGDVIRATYTESIVLRLRKAGTAPGETGLAGGRFKDTPGGALVAQETATVTIKSIDPAVPSITVATADGRTFTRKVQNKKDLEGVSAGDRIELTSTRALVVAAEPAKK